MDDVVESELKLFPRLLVGGWKDRPLRFLMKSPAPRYLVAPFALCATISFASALIGSGLARWVALAATCVWLSTAVAVLAKSAPRGSSPWWRRQDS